MVPTKTDTPLSVLLFPVPIKNDTPLSFLIPLPNGLDPAR